MPIIIEPDAYYSEEETAELYGVVRDTVRRKRRTTSDLPFCRYGRRIFYRGSDIIAALQDSRRISTSDPGPQFRSGPQSRPAPPGSP